MIPEIYKRKQFLLAIINLMPAILYVFALLNYYPGWFSPIDLTSVILQIIICLWVITLLVFYIRHLIINPDLTAKEKKLWAAGMILTHYFGILTSWYLYMWREPKRLLSKK